MERDAKVSVHWQPTGSGALCRQILEALPGWFGIPEAVDEYAAIADRSPTVVVSDEGIGLDIGFLTLVRHSPDAAEVYVMGVLPAQHRNGFGRQLLAAAEQRLVETGTRFLQVKTLSPRHPNIGYAATRAFYFASGFRTLEEFPELWGSEWPALQLIKSLGVE